MTTNFIASGTDLDDYFIRKVDIAQSGLIAWGKNSVGEFGLNNTTNYTGKLVPVTFTPLLSNWASAEIEARSNSVITSTDPLIYTTYYYFSAVAIKKDGTLWTWGSSGSNGQLGSGNTSSRSSPGTTAGGGTNWKQVSLNENSMAAVKTNGTLWTWGSNGGGVLGDGTTVNKSSPITTAGGGTNWKQVCVGVQEMAAVKTDGTLWTWGVNTSGRLGTGDTVSRSSPGTTAGGGTNWNYVSIGAVAAAIKTDGTLWTWGANNYGQLGTGDITVRSSPVTTAGGGTNWKQIAVAPSVMAAIKTDGTLWLWGYGGGLGDYNNISRSSPATINGGGTNWKYVSLNNEHGAAIKTDGTIWTWGYGAIAAQADYGPKQIDSNSNRWISVSVKGTVNTITYGDAHSGTAALAIMDTSI